jgi:eukaryotic-like serine/threonine-protein kinase
MSAKLTEGTVFAGRYRVVRCLAAGGMGAVYEVIHLETDRRRALKVMHPHLFQSEEMRERFKREARIAAQVDSEYIVDVSDAGVDDATQMPFLVMELLRGEELGDRLKRLGRLPLEEVVTYMQQAAWALDRTHAASIVHRDLKPENLFLTTREDGSPRIKILDFGVAKLVAEGATAVGATRSLGTPLYMAPEQFRAGTKLTASADIHALTLMTYTLLVGAAYWAEEAKIAGDVIAFAMLVVQGPQESPVQRAQRRGVLLPPGFDAWFARGTAVNPADRFATATEAVRALSLAASAAPRAMSGPVPALGAMTPYFADSSAGSGFLIGAPVQPVNAALERAGTSTGAAMTPAMPPSRAPLHAALGLLGLAVLGLGGWLTVRAVSGRAPATAATTEPVAAATALPTPKIAPVAPASAEAPAPRPEAAATETPTAAPPIAAPSAKSSGARPASAPSAKPTATPGAKPSAAPAAKPLFGRD